MIGGLLATLVGSAWACAALRYSVTALAILLFLLALRRSGAPLLQVAFEIRCRASRKAALSECLRRSQRS